MKYQKDKTFSINNFKENAYILNKNKEYISKIYKDYSEDYLFNISYIKKSCLELSLSIM